MKFAVRCLSVPRTTFRPLHLTLNYRKLAAMSFSDYCQPERIEQYLQGVMLPPACDELEAHLANCKVCQRLIEDGAAKSSEWAECAEILSTHQDTLGHTAHEQSLIAQVKLLSIRGLEAADRQSTTMAYLRNWLAPSPELDGALGRLADYRITQVIGIGGMGIVLKATDLKLNRVVAIKSLAPFLADREKARSDFVREASLAASLRHPNVIEIYAVDTWQGVPYVVMPYLANSLQSLGKSAPMKLSACLCVAKQIADALTAAHAAGMVHRDIKPSNILLEDGIDSVVLSDFGLARLADEQGGTATGAVAGTPQFMSPEQAQGKRVDHRSDLFSLGLLLYWMATGNVPFQADNVLGLMRQIAEEPHAPASKVNSVLPKWFDRLVNCLLTKDRELRAGNSAAVADDIGRCLAYVRTPEKVKLPARVLPAKSNYIILSSVLAAVVCLAAIPVWHSLTQKQSRESEALTRSATANLEESGDAAIQEQKRDSRKGDSIQLPGEHRRMGPLDDLDLLNFEEDFQQRQNLDYWQCRFAELQTPDIPDLVVQLLTEHQGVSDPRVNALAETVFAKDPFQVVEQPSKVDMTSPFEEVAGEKHE